VRGGGFSLAERIIVAGGGGGAGWIVSDIAVCLGAGADGYGGAGGQSGGNGYGANQVGAIGGSGASPDAGGKGGSGSASSGGSGELGVGGAGDSEFWCGGGGGGGGAFGGGGGAIELNRSGGGGGGGGSGLGPAGTVFQTGVRGGDGQVIVTWARPAAPAALDGTLRASDGQSLAIQPTSVQTAFQAQHGASAASRWVFEHETELSRATP
jgi:hypothetical protein